MRDLREGETASCDLHAVFAGLSVQGALVAIELKGVAVGRQRRGGNKASPNA